MDTLYDRFTDQARRAMGKARDYAAELQHECIDADHIFLGLCATIEKPSEMLRKLQMKVALAMQPGGISTSIGETMPWAPSARRVLDCVAEMFPDSDSDKIGISELTHALFSSAEASHETRAKRAADDYFTGRDIAAELGKEE